MPEACQYIVVRKDLVEIMGYGKLGAQIAHASVGSILERKNTFILNKRIYENDKNNTYSLPELKQYFDQRNVTLIDSPASRSWFEGSFTKLVVYVKTEQKLLNLSKKLDDLGIINKLIYDAGRTVFNGETTLICLGVEPIFRSEVPKCLQELRLLD